MGIPTLSYELVPDKLWIQSVSLAFKTIMMYYRRSITSISDKFRLVLNMVT